MQGKKKSKTKSEVSQPLWFLNPIVSNTHLNETFINIKLNYIFKLILNIK